MALLQKIEVYVFRRRDSDIEYLLLKRNPRLGGYWQPITGSIEKEESPREAAIREICEETGKCDVKRLIGPLYCFRYVKEGKEFEEHVFGLESDDTPVMLSNEHTDRKWFRYEEALKALRWDENREGLRRLNVELEKVC